MMHEFQTFNSPKTVFVQHHWQIMGQHTLQALMFAAAFWAVGFFTGLPLVFASFGAVGISFWLVRHLWQDWAAKNATVWMIQASNRKTIAHTLDNESISLDWIKVDKVEISGEGILLVGAKRQCIEIASAFPQFQAISDHVIEMADFYEVPVFIEGDRWTRRPTTRSYALVETKVVR